MVHFLTGIGTLGLKGVKVKERIARVLHRPSPTNYPQMTDKKMILQTSSTLEGVMLSCLQIDKEGRTGEKWEK